MEELTTEEKLKGLKLGELYALRKIILSGGNKSDEVKSIPPTDLTQLKEYNLIRKSKRGGIEVVKKVKDERGYLQENWSSTDYEVLHELIMERENRKVAEKMKKERERQRI